MKNWRPTKLQPAIAGGAALVLTIVVLVSCGSGVESYTCADIAASSEKTAEVDDYFEQRYAEALGVPESTVNSARVLVGSTASAECNNAKPDDKVWSILQPYIDELQAAKDSESQDNLKVLEDKVAEVASAQVGSEVQSVSCGEFPAAGQSADCEITFQGGISQTFAATVRYEGDVMQITLDAPG